MQLRHRKISHKSLSYMAFDAIFGYYKAYILEGENMGTLEGKSINSRNRETAPEAAEPEKKMGDYMREIMAWPAPPLPAPTHNAPKRKQ